MPLINVTNVVKDFPQKRNADQPTFRTILSLRGRGIFRAVDDINFEIDKGKGKLVAYIDPNSAGDYAERPTGARRILASAGSVLSLGQRMQGRIGCSPAPQP